MSLTPVTNFGKGTVSTTYNAAATSIVLAAGHGSRFPSTFPYPLVWWDSTDHPDPADDPKREIVTVTARTGDTLTVTRGAEGTGASTKNTAGNIYKVALSITKAMWEYIDTLNLPQTFRGLRLGTNYDNALSTKSTIFSADVIVLNDGEAVHDWENVVTDITASGAQGLDTGTEQNSVWYEQYAIYNGTNKYGCLHRAKDWFLDVDITAGEDATQGIRSNVDNSTVRVAQSFEPVTSGKLMFIDVKLLKVGSPTGNIWFTLEAGAGSPDGTALATSWAFDVSRLLTTATVIRFPFVAPATVAASTRYHIVARGGWTVSGTDYVGWRMDGSAAAYAGGMKQLYDSDTTTWTGDPDDDLWLRAYIERNNVDFSTTVPAGYRYALIGYVYNNSAGNMLRFTQQDREWRLLKPGTDGLVVNETTAANTLVDLRSVLPASPLVTAHFSSTGTGASVAEVAIGDLTATDLEIATAPGQWLALLYSATTSERRYVSGRAPVRYCAAMVDATAGADLYVEGFTW